VGHPYPEYWEADVVLRDGGTAHVRPIGPDDADRLLGFYRRLSDQSKYFRFFAPHATLSEREVHRLTHPDYRDEVGLLAQVGTEMIGLVGYYRLDEAVQAGPEAGQEVADEPPLAEVAFLIEDAHQQRGLASVLLEHIAAIAWERGIRRFVAEVLPQNRKMLVVFQAIGYPRQVRHEDGIIHCEVDLEPTETFLAVQQVREHRAEARSIARLLAPRSVAVIGASRTPDTIGHALLRNLLDAGFTGRLYPVNPHVEAVDGVPAYPSVAAIPGPVDLAIVAVPAGVVHQVVVECGDKDTHGLIVISDGFAERGSRGRQRQTRLVQLTRTHGMRLIGPNCLGVLNTDPQVRLNASVSPIIPEQGRIGVFAQSGALGIAILDTMVQRGLGLSSFVSAGNRADVSGNDLLQYWEEDPATDVILLYLESVGNPRKFTRLSRRVARTKSAGSSWRSR
jgi:succinyl-CoA synthetase alpha subunit/RimJ/RimL family protein N-acetyltransferase